MMKMYLTTTQIYVTNDCAVGMFSGLFFIRDTFRNIKVYNVDLNTKYIINNISDYFPELTENNEDSAVAGIHYSPSHYYS